VRITPRGIGEEQEAFLLLPLGFGRGAAASCTRKSIAELRPRLRCARSKPGALTPFNY